MTKRLVILFLIEYSDEIPMLNQHSKQKQALIFYLP